MKIVFISGPYKADDLVKQDVNIRLAIEFAVRLWSHGHAVVCPHANSRNFELFGIDDNLFLEGYLRMLERCDAVVTLPRWNESEGATAEVKHATLHDIPVYHLDTQACWAHVLGELGKDLT